MVALNFNAHNVEPSSGERQILPEGWYRALIIKTEQKPVKDSDDKKFFLAMTMQLQSVETGQTYEGVVNRFNLWNDNPEAVRIAQGDLSKLCHVLRVFDITNTEQLHNIPFQIKVTHQTDKGKIVGNNFPDMRYADGAEFKKGQNGAPHPNPATQNPQAFGGGQPAPGPQGGFGQGQAPQGGQPGGFQPQGPAGGFGGQPGGQPQPGGFGGQPAPGQPQGGAAQPWGGQPQGGQPGGFGGAPQGGQGFQPQNPGGFQPQQPQAPQGGFAGGAPGGFAPQGPAGGFGGAPQGGGFGNAPGSFGGGAPQGQGGPWGGPQG